MARVARFYGIDPLQFPMWYLETLQRCIPLLRAEEELYMTDAVRLAMAAKNHYSAGVRRLRNAARAVDPRESIIIVADERMLGWFEREFGGKEIRILVDE